MRPTPRRPLVLSLVAALALAPLAVVASTGSTAQAADGPEPTTYGVSAGPLGTVVIPADATAVRREARDAGATKVADYGSFSLWNAGDDATDLAGRRAVDARATIELRGLDLDTTADVPAPARLAAGHVPGHQLRLVQLAGPVREEWVALLEGVGAEPVAYVPSDAYVVWVDAAGAAALDAMVADEAAVRFSGPFHPAYKLAPTLRDVAVETTGDGATVTVDVQVVAAEAGAVDTVTAGRTVVREPTTADGLTSLTVEVGAGELADLAAVPAVLDVEPYVAPQRYDEAQNQLLAGNVTTTPGGATVPSGPGYMTWLTDHDFPESPLGYPVVSVVDDGIDNGADEPLHADFFQLGDIDNADRLTSNVNCTSDTTANGLGGHGTLNAGIVGGFNDKQGTTYEDADGYNYGQGVSPYGRIAGVKIFTNATGAFSIGRCGTDVGAIVQAAVDQGADLTSNSWGADVGGAYTVDSQAYDRLTRDADPGTAGLQEMLHVFSAGNAGPSLNTIGSPGTAKNVLTVGATENVREDGSVDGCGIGDDGADNDSDIIFFSSRGPTDDGRVKPDVVAAGTHVQGPATQAGGYNGDGVCGGSNASPDRRFHPDGSVLYTWSSGTSHSAPAVAGAVSLAHNYYGRVLAPDETASPAMLKALMANGGRWLDGIDTGDDLPSNDMGWGVPNLGQMVDGLSRLIEDQQTLLTATGQEHTAAASVGDPTEPVRVTLAWTDAPGSTVGSAFVNDLDLVVEVGGETYRGNVMAGPVSQTGGTADTRNNLESVWLPAGTTGPVTITVVASNVAGNGVPGNATTLDQDFALLGSNLAVAPPEVSVGTTRVREGNRGSRSLSFPVTLDAAAGSAVSVAFATRTGSAGARDFTATSGTLTIPAGTTSTTVDVPVTGDLLDEPDETLALVLSAPSGAPLGTARATGTIVDDDPAPTVTLGKVTVREGDRGKRTVKVPVTLSAPSGRVVTLVWRTSDGSAKAKGRDYVKATGTVRIGAGSKRAVIKVTVRGDRRVERDETFKVVASKLRNATFKRSRGVVTIRDDD